MNIASCHWLLINLVMSTFHSSSSFKVSSSSVVSSSTVEEKETLAEGIIKDESKVFHSHESLLRVKRKGSRLSTTGRKGPRDRLDYRKNTSSPLSSSTRRMIFIQLCTIIFACNL